MKQTSQAKRTIVVLSEEYLAADVISEWTVAFAGDSKGKKGKLLPIKVKPVSITGKLQSITAIDLINLSKQEAKEKLIEEIKASKDGIRIKPSTEPFFPGTKIESSHAAQSQIQSPQPFTVEPSSFSRRNIREESHEFKAGLVDKEEQAKHVFKSTGNEFYGKGIKQISQSAFLLIGAASQWPFALIHILYYEIKKRYQFNNHGISKQSSPEPVILNGRVLKDNISPE